MKNAMMVISYLMMDAMIANILVLKIVIIVSKVLVKVVNKDLYSLFQNVFLIAEMIKSQLKIMISVI